MLFYIAGRSSQTEQSVRGVCIHTECVKRNHKTAFFCWQRNQESVMRKMRKVRVGGIEGSVTRCTGGGGGGGVVVKFVYVALNIFKGMTLFSVTLSA